MAVVTTAGTPLGTGLIRYLAVGGEPIRDATHYTGLNTPSGTYVAGETVEVLLDAGYSQLNPLTKDHLLGAYRTPFATAVQTNQGSNKSYHLQLEFVTDLATNSDLAAFEALQDAGMQGATLFWYPDWVNYPTEFIPCVIRKRNNPQRNGVVFTIGLDLESIVTSEQEPALYLPPYISTYSVSPTGMTVKTAVHNASSTVIRSWSAWVKYDASTVSYETRILMDYHNTSGLYRGSSPNGGLVLTYFVNGVTKTLTVPTVYDLTVWTHVGYTIDGANGQAKVYVNGSMVASSNFTPEALNTGLAFADIVYPTVVGSLTLYEGIKIAQAAMFEAVEPDFVFLSATSPTVNPSDAAGLVWWYSLDGTLLSSAGDTATVTDSHGLGFTYSFVTDVPQ